LKKNAFKEHNSSMNWKIGEVEIIQIVEMEGGALIQQFMPDWNEEDIKKVDFLYPDFVDENGNLKALVQSFLIKSDGKNILVDTCNGNGKNRPTCPSWGNLNTDYLEKLSQVVKREEVDLVICTHLHFDHVGWNTYLKDGQFVPTFPNAKYLFVKEEFDYWQSKPDSEADDDKLAFDDSIKPVVEAGLAEFVESNHKVDQNIHFVPTPGHTPGHVTLMIESNGKKAFISGDLIHHPCQQLAYPDWLIGADGNPEKTLESRKKILSEMADSGTLFIGTHFSNPVAGLIVKKGENFSLKLN
jgi:glyoxylase-like metal-dependent hydrolase (beta-lactamase superfamily II)